jgi:hypothetical protein
VAALDLGEAIGAKEYPMNVGRIREIVQQAQQEE